MCFPAESEVPSLLWDRNVRKKCLTVAKTLQKNPKTCRDLKALDTPVFAVEVSHRKKLKLISANLGDDLIAVSPALSVIDKTRVFNFLWFLFCGEGLFLRGAYLWIVRSSLLDISS